MPLRQWEVEICKKQEGKPATEVNLPLRTLWPGFQSPPFHVCKSQALLLCQGDCFFATSVHIVFSEQGRVSSNPLLSAGACFQYKVPSFHLRNCQPGAAELRLSLRGRQVS